MPEMKERDRDEIIENINIEATDIYVRDFTVILMKCSIILESEKN